MIFIQSYDVSDNGIIVKNVTKAFKAQKVLENLNLYVRTCEKTVIVGPSGVGKSTLLRIVAGLEFPDTGEIYIEGQLVSNSRWVLEPHRRNIGFVFQNPTLWPHMTVRDNIRFGLLSQSDKVANEYITSLLEKAKIGHTIDKYPDQLSGGEAKRAALVRSIAPQPKFLLVDEPFANLDVETKFALLDFLLDTVDTLKMTMIYVTHDAEEIDRINGTVIRFTPMGV